ncbi:MAG: type II toxin-antitoxin system VapC family toxin [Actinomycetaceae bacterium]|nr:type II toxin-antitoxin system VapC family toxin [Actinomycetaceae bacterium]
MIYLDASAALKLFINETESADLYDFLLAQQNIFSSTLLEVELSRALRRLNKPLDAIEPFLAGFNLIEIDQEIVSRARSLTLHLKSLDAIHLASAMFINSARNPVSLVSYDLKLLEAAKQLGLTVLSPGLSE